MNVLSLLKEHTSVRSYTNEPVEAKLLRRILEAAQFTSTSSHIQAYSVIRVTDPDKRRTLRDAAGGQKWVVDAPEFLVFCADLHRLDIASKNQGMGELEGQFEHSLAAVVDVALYAQSVLLAAESVGLGGVFIGGIRNNPSLVIETLDLPQQVFPVFGMCLGWPAAQNATKPRLPLDEILHTDSFDQSKTSGNLAEFDRLMADYYSERGTDDRRNWSKTVSGALQTKKREHMKDVLSDQGFFKR